MNDLKKNTIKTIKHKKYFTNKIFSLTFLLGFCCAMRKERFRPTFFFRKFGQKLTKIISFFVFHSIFIISFFISSIFKRKNIFLEYNFIYQKLLINYFNTKP
jgi:hypothetical protein